MDKELPENKNTIGKSNDLIQEHVFECHEAIRALRFQLAIAEARREDAEARHNLLVPHHAAMTRERDALQQRLNDDATHWFHRCNEADLKFIDQTALVDKLKAALAEVPKLGDLIRMRTNGEATAYEQAKHIFNQCAEALDITAETPERII